MTRFVESPLYDNWFKEYSPKKELLLCTPYIKQKAFNEILKLYNLENDCKNVDIKILIRGNPEEFNASKSSDISIIDSFINQKGLKLDNIKRVKNLHMKAYLIDKEHLLITSGNLTNSGMFVFSEKENFEGGIATDDKEVIDAFLRYFNGIGDQGELFEVFCESLLNSYKDYVSKEYSDKKTIKRIKKDSYKFNIKSKLKKSDTANTYIDAHNNEAVLSTAKEYLYSLDDLPPVGDRDYVVRTLEILKNNPNGMTYVNLGRALRKELEFNDLDNATNNSKFGEEKGKYLVYFNLATITRSSSNIFKINKLGELYLKMTGEEQEKFLNDQLFSKPIIVDIIKRSTASDFDLDKYLAQTFNAATSTLNRKKGTINKLLEDIKQIEEK